MPSDRIDRRGRQYCYHANPEVTFVSSRLEPERQFHGGLQALTNVATT